MYYIREGKKIAYVEWRMRKGDREIAKRMPYLMYKSFISKEDINNQITSLLRRELENYE